MYLAFICFRLFLYSALFLFFFNRTNFLMKVFYVLLLFCCQFLYSQSKVYSSFQTDKKEIALTFDACESKTPAFMDTVILNFLIKEKIPATIFLSGKFCKTNSVILKAISKYNFIEFENHSFSHIKHTERLTEPEIEGEVKEAENLIKTTTGYQPRFFRFPAGNCSSRALGIVEKLGLKTVHWSFASGDPNKKISSRKLKNWVLSKTKPGSILIFHINGRGYRTGEILPELISEFRKNQFSFVKLKDVKLK